MPRLGLRAVSPSGAAARPDLGRTSWTRPFPLCSRSPCASSPFAGVWGVRPDSGLLPQSRHNATRLFVPPPERLTAQPSLALLGIPPAPDPGAQLRPSEDRSEEHTSELQSLMRISYAFFCLKKKTRIKRISR